MPGDAWNVRTGEVQVVRSSHSSAAGEGRQQHVKPPWNHEQMKAEASGCVLLIEKQIKAERSKGGSTGRRRTLPPISTGPNRVVANGKYNAFVFRIALNPSRSRSCLMARPHLTVTHANGTQQSCCERRTASATANCRGGDWEQKVGNLAPRDPGSSWTGAHWGCESTPAFSFNDRIRQANGEHT